MPNTKGAKKRVRVLERKTQRNRIFKSRIKTAIKKFEKALEENNLEEAKENYKEATKLLSKAVNKGIYHKNKAARKKSILSRKLNEYTKDEKVS